MPMTLTFTGPIAQIKDEVVEFAARFSGDQLLEIASQPASVGAAEALLSQVALAIGYDGSDQSRIPSLVANLKLELEQANRRHPSLVQEVESLTPEAKPTRRKKKEVLAPGSGLTAESSPSVEVPDQTDGHTAILPEHIHGLGGPPLDDEVAAPTLPAGAEPEDSEPGPRMALTPMPDAADVGGARPLTNEERTKLVDAFREHGVTDPRAIAMMQAQCGVSSSRELTVAMRDHLMTVLQASAAKVPF